ncbi:MAG TPA: hypothetical protein VKE94_01300, partial [Gemmataceae bacterium]|nr:hypothetical protein [Gemmataceae bacterium]
HIMTRVVDPTLPTSRKNLSRFARSRAWLGRNRVRLTASVTTLLIAGSILTGGFILELDRRSAQEELAENQARQQRQQRAALVREIELLRHSRTIRHVDNFSWSDRAMRCVREAAVLQPDDDLRDLAAAVLVGWDARMVRRVVEFGASSIAFGSYFVMLGGLEDDDAKLWAGSGYGPWPSGKIGPGPVASIPDRLALQLVATDGPAVGLWAFQQKIPARTYPFATRTPPVVRVARRGLDLPVLALASDASVLAAAGMAKDGNRVVAVWERSADRPRFQIDSQAHALLFSPKQDILAVGDENGQVTLLSAATGKQNRVLQADRCSIESLTFSLDGSRIAAGDAAGVVTAWDLVSGTRLTTCRGGDAGVFSLAFNLDGTLLATGGSGSTKLWDIATGQQLFELRSEDTVAGLAFSPEGNRLLTCSTGRAARPEVHLWQLEDGRGIRSLPGLAAPVVLVRFSTEGKLLAGVAQDGRVAIWETALGRLQRTFDGSPQVDAADAALVFSPDGTRLALAAGREARLWEVSTGKQLGAWKLPPGSNNALLFHSTGKVLLARVESEAGGPMPRPGSDLRAHPCVCRVVELVPPNAIHRVTRIADFNRRMDDIQAIPQSDWFVIEGTGGDSEGTSHGLKIVDALTGKEIWAGPELMRAANATVRLDQAGKVLAYRLSDPGQAVAVEVPTGKTIHYLHNEPQAIGSDAGYWLAAGTTPGRGYLLYRAGDSKPLVTLGLDLSITTPQPQFSPDGTRIAWGNADGSVCLCDIEEVRRRLNDVGLGW